MQKVSRSKRLWVTLGAQVFNALLFFYGIQKGIDLTTLGVGIGMINAPVYTYLGVESWKPSNKKPNDKDDV